MAEFQNILYEKRGRIAYVTINRPDRLNAINLATSREMYSAFCDFRDDPEVWVAILTGAGERAFSAGADLEAITTGELAMGGPGQGMPVPFGGIVRGFQCWKPIIAAINGLALGGGLEVALACDIRVASENAEFGLPEPRWALIPGGGGTQRLPRVLPLAVAMELLLTGGRLNAQQALQWGLVSRVVPLPELIPTAEKIAQAICDNGPLAVRAIKEAAYRGLEMPLEHGLNLELTYIQGIFHTEDAKEGPKAFLEKRKPQFRGR